MAENYLNILADTIRNNWDAPALTDFYLTEDGSAQDTSRGNHYTYGEMYAEICRVANLLTSLGLQKGDHIAICGANSAHWVIAYLAIAKMQGVSVTVMHTLMPDEIARLVAFSDAKALFTDEDLWAEISPRLGRGDGDRLSSVISLSDWSILRGEKIQISNLQSSISNFDCGFPQSNPDDLAMICFTSGTSGSAKGVMLSINSISNNVAYKLNIFAHYEGTNVLAILPFAHIYGLVIELLLPLCAGAITNIIISNTISIKNIVGSCKLLKPKIIFVVPRVVEYLISENFDLTRIFSGLDFLSVGGAELKKDTEHYLQQNNIGIAVGYGSTECGTRITLATPQEYRSGSVGKIVNGLELKISPAGEILVKGENVMLGYYKDPEATAAKIDKDGWLHTGDKGHLDEDGYLYVEGRLEQDIIVLPNGENIRPDHIESLINALPEVSESIVLARDGHLVAIVVPATPSSVSSASSVTSASSASSESSETRASSPSSSLRRKILRTVNPSLPLFSQLYDVEITDQPLARTEKQTLKRYLYS